jgi:hypothetical protein
MLETGNIWENIPQKKGKPERVLRDCGKHWQDGQYALLYSEDNQSAAHFVGRVEFFDRDFTTVLKVVLNFVFESDRECETCDLRLTFCFVQRIDKSGKMLAYYKNKGFTTANDSGHKKYVIYYKTQRMKDVIAAHFASDMKLGYTFESPREEFIPARYQDGRAARDLHFGDVV